MTPMCRPSGHAVGTVAFRDQARRLLLGSPPEKRKVGGSTPPLATPPGPHLRSSGCFCAIMPVPGGCPLLTATTPYSPPLVARMSHGDPSRPPAGSCPRAPGWVVIFSRRGLVPAGPGAGAQGTRFRLALRWPVWLPSWRAGRRSPPSGCPRLIFERCRVWAEPAVLGDVVVTLGWLAATLRVSWVRRGLWWHRARGGGWQCRRWRPPWWVRASPP